MKLTKSIILAFILIFTFMFSISNAYTVKPVVAPTITFTDLGGFEWAEESITNMANQGVLNGIGNFLFAPQNNVTRAEFATMIVKLKDYQNEVADSVFNDVGKGSWYYQFVSIAFDHEIIKGTSEATFEPEAYITRQDVAVIIARSFNLKSTVTSTNSTLSVFNDKNYISDYASGAVAACVNKGILKGNPDGTFKPLNRATRAEAAVMLNNISSIFTQIRNPINGVNWADPGDNFQSGVIYVSGLSSSDTYSTANATATAIVDGFISKVGSNTVRMPINEATVSSYWDTYTGAIDAALSKGKVILCYWAYQNGEPADISDYWQMWNTVVSKYAGNSNCYFEPINEPYGYNVKDLADLYNSWITAYTNVPQNRVILDGSGYAEDVKVIGADDRFANCLLAVHDYAFWKTFSTEKAWQNDLANEVGNYGNRTVMTEWGCRMTNGKNYNTSNSQDNEILYLRGISNELRILGMGSAYWPGLRDGDSFSITKRSGSGSDTTLAVTNLTGLARIKYAWGTN